MEGILASILVDFGGFGEPSWAGKPNQKAAKGREGKGRAGKAREGKGKEGQEREGKGSGGADFRPRLGRGRVYLPLKGGTSPGPWTPRIAKCQNVLFRFCGHLGAFHFSIAFSMPLGIDLGSIFPPNLLPKIHQNPLKIDAKMPSHLESII